MRAECLGLGLRVRQEEDCASSSLGQPERERKPEAPPLHRPQTKTCSQRAALFMPPPATHGLQQQIQTCPPMVLANLTAQAVVHPQASNTFSAWLFTPLY